MCMEMFDIIRKMFKLDALVYGSWTYGLYVAHYPNRLRVGVSTDLAIEQCLMSSLETSGRLTKGRGFIEIQQSIGVLSSPACADAFVTIHSCTGRTFSTNETHKEASPSGMSKDLEDINEIMECVKQKNMFSGNITPGIQNIITWVVANSTVNCDQA